MVQLFDLSPTQSSASMIGSALGQGMAKNFPDPQQLVQRGMLQEAMARIPKNASYVDMLKSIGPQLMTTPGGAQLLGELGPILQREASTRAGMNYWNQVGGAGQEPAPLPGQPQAVSPPGQAARPQVTPTPGEVRPGGESWLRSLDVPTGKESTYPKMANLPEPMPMMTPQQLLQRKALMTAQYMAQGVPADPVAIDNAIQNEQAQIQNYNQGLEKQRLARDQKQQDQSQRVMSRFESSDLVDKKDTEKSKEDKFIFEQFANEAKDAANENDQYRYARAKFKQYDNARNAIQREEERPGFFEKLYKKMQGTYKTKEDAMKSLYPPVKQLIDLGQEQQARRMLSEDVGLGMEDTELTMFPLTPEEKKSYASFPKNTEKSYTFTGFGAPPVQTQRKYPGEEVALKPENYNKFKGKVLETLTQNPGSNLVGMRGILNHDLKYSWTDFSRAVNELVQEGLFNPDPIQQQQMNVIKSPPMPGLLDNFREFYEERR